MIHEEMHLYCIVEGSRLGCGDVRTCNGKNIYYSDREEAYKDLYELQLRFPKARFSIVSLHPSQVTESWCDGQYGA